MKGSGGPTNPLYLLFFLLFDKLFSKKKKRRTRSSASLAASREQRKKENISRMRTITDRYKDHTAEVMTFYVNGIDRVQRFREVKIGDSLEIRLHNDGPKIFAHGEYMADLNLDPSSRLERLLRENISFHAYLGGRDMSMSWNIEYDFCSLIIFYKLPGIGPTIVNLEG